MSKKKSNEKIKCDVESCKYNNCDDECCELESISVSCTCDKDDCSKTDETVCASFETTKSPITDTEYEVQAETEESDETEEEES